VLTEDTAPWALACPACGEPLGPRGDAELVECDFCWRGFAREGGIWRFLPAERLAALTPFLADYTRIRRAEGRGADDPAYYRLLPDCDPCHPLAWQWGIRRRTFAALCDRVLPGLGDGLRVLDLGAGVGWLSRWLADLGHHPCAVDLSVDDQDGLGAARHYRPEWPRLQAEFDRLPIASGTASVVLYNASFHYSTDYRTTLGEALRVLRPGGAIVILDTPIYRREESGRRMAAERHASFAERFGTASDSLPSIEFLTWDMVDDLGRDLGVTWERIPVWYGWKWALRPWLARLKRKREPSEFVILVGRKGRIGS
jgi:SAM-dependent methyltransferase